MPTSPSPLEFTLAAAWPTVAVEQPWFLLLLGILPLIWWFSFRSLSGMGPVRRIFALLLRTGVVLLLILALANLQLVRISESLTVIYLLDQSASIPAEKRQAMVDFVSQQVQRHRDDRRRDKASVIVFGRQANIEVPPLDDDLPIYGHLETAGNLRVDATNLEAALKLAQATFPEDCARRVVVVSDGNENLGDALPIAKQLAEDGVGIDVVPVFLPDRHEVAVERLVIPSDVRRGQPFEARVVINNFTPPSPAAPPSASSPPPARSISGRVRLLRKYGNVTETLAEESVELPPGKTVYRFQQEIERPDFYQYEVTFAPDDSQSDLSTENNRATAFSHVQGQGQILWIEDWENRDAAGDGQFHDLVERLRAANLEVTVQFTDQLFTSLAQLQRYDSVVLANVPRTSGTDTETLADFSDAQVAMLVRNVQQMGCGLVMLGGENSYGAGGWASTELEKAMPVDFQIKNAKIKAVGALALVMHASEMAEGNYWQKQVAHQSIKMLGPQDYCGVVHWDDSTFKEGWLWGKPTGIVRVGTNRDVMLARVDGMTPGDMPEFEPAMKMTLAAFSQIPDAAVKHMIIISDGDPSPARRATVNALNNLKVTISTVAVGTHGAAGSSELKKLADLTGGKYYKVRSANALPKIYSNEVRKIAKPLVVEREIQPEVRPGHEILAGIQKVPMIEGFVMTTLKSSPLVEVLMTSPYPADPDNATLLACWTYGLGRTAVLTTDAGRRWATPWPTWEEYDKLFSQLLRWSMRRTGDTGNFSVASRVIDDKVRLVVDALDKDEEFLNFLNMSATVVGPNMEARDVPLRQVAPGRYEGDVPVDGSGSYLVTVNPGGGKGMIRTGVNVPYSSEYLDRQTNQELLTAMAGVQPVGGKSGQLLTGFLDATKLVTQEVPTGNTFRATLAASRAGQSVWPRLLFWASSIFLADVFVRRVALSFDWLPKLWEQVRARFTGQTVAADVDSRMARLRNRKAEVAAQVDQRRQTTRWEGEAPSEPTASGGTPLPERSAGASTSPAPPKMDIEGDAATETYTERLLKAKKRSQEERE